jgi:tRNA (guanine37-N1)-methyltransferase
VTQALVTDEVSIGDYVLTGELAALVVLDAVVRLVPGRGGRCGVGRGRIPFARGLLDHPHYTRPAVFRGWRCRTSCCPAITPDREVARA